MIVWRLSRYTDLQGFGGIQVSGRWHEKGNPIVYAAASASTALLEVLVHLDIDPEDIPDDIKLIEIGIPNNIALAAEEVGVRNPILVFVFDKRLF